MMDLLEIFLPTSWEGARTCTPTRAPMGTGEVQRCTSPAEATGRPPPPPLSHTGGGGRIHATHGRAPLHRDAGKRNPPPHFIPPRVYPYKHLVHDLGTKSLGGKPSKKMGTGGGPVRPLSSRWIAPVGWEPQSRPIGGVNSKGRGDRGTPVGYPPSRTPTPPSPPQGGLRVGGYLPYPPTSVMGNGGWGAPGGGEGGTPEAQSRQCVWGTWSCQTPLSMPLQRSCRRLWQN